MAERGAKKGGVETDEVGRACWGCVLLVEGEVWPVLTPHPRPLHDEGRKDWVVCLRGCVCPPLITLSFSLFFLSPLFPCN